MILLLSSLGAAQFLPHFMPPDDYLDCAEICIRRRKIPRYSNLRSANVESSLQLAGLWIVRDGGAVWEDFEAGPKAWDPLRRLNEL